MPRSAPAWASSSTHSSIYTVSTGELGRGWSGRSASWHSGSGHATRSSSTRRAGIPDPGIQLVGGRVGIRKFAAAGEALSWVDQAAPPGLAISGCCH